MKEIQLEEINERFYRLEQPINQKWLYEAIQEVLKRIDRMLIRFTDTFPNACTINGIYYPVEKLDWTEGFWVGILWLAYEVTGEEKYQKVAINFLSQFDDRLEKKIKTNTHDLGFLYSLACVSAYKVTGNQKARDTALYAAELLYERYNSIAGIIQAWGDLNDPQKQGRMIIDCTLNLPLLFWAYDESGEKKYLDAAKKHLNNSMTYLVREDASTYHTYFMDINTGRGIKGTTHQGFSDESCWARGQAWGIYGFALNYRYYKNLELIEISKRVTNYYLNRLPEDYVCYWDLIFRDEDKQCRDTSSTAIAVCGILEIIRELPLCDPCRKPYENAVCSMINSLRDNYLTDKEDGFLLHGVYNYGRSMGIDEVNLWGDYYYLEALIRMKKVWNPYW
jgi:unsaturated chondroitin disaccharide hydrolase